MNLYYFPDNTVLVNFASVHRIHLLIKILDGRGRWTEAVAHEAKQSTRFHGDLTTLIESRALGEAIVLDDPGDIRKVEHLRRAVFGGSPQQATKHLGEATTCHLLTTRTELQDSYWITDDRDAADYARRQGITTRETLDLLSEGIAVGDCSRPEAWQLLLAMRKAGNYLKVPESMHQM